MWHPTDSNTESDNKKLEQSSAVAATNTAATSSSRVNDFNNFGNNFHQKKEQEDETFDSGICSGQLTSSSNIDSEEFTQQSYHQQEATNQFNIPTATASSQQQKKQIEETVLDSGCIVSEPIEEDLEFTDSPQQQEQKQINDPMKFKKNVDDMTDRICQIGLHATESSATIGINNLNFRSSNQRNKQQQQQYEQQNQQQLHKLLPKCLDLDASNAWERFYQQNDEGDTALHIAALLGEEVVVEALIRMVPHPCLFNIQNDEGQTALHMAARAQQPKILRKLLIAGAEPLIRDCRGNTALHLACGVADMQCVSALLTKIALSEIQEAHRQFGHRDPNNKESLLICAQLPTDLEIRNYDGLRCVHIAAQMGHLEILRRLEEYGADMNSREGLSGYTPLHIAIINNNEEIINFLLNDCKHLNIEAESYAGRTAYQIADKLEKYQMTNILKERGAEPLTPPESEFEYSDIESDDEKDWFGEHQLMSNFTLLVA